MGLIKAGVSAVGGTLKDQWKEYIKCDDLGNEILMKKVTTPNGVISKSSAIQVSPGQVAIVFQNGKILDATAEEGIFTFDESTSPSFFSGQFGDVFKEMWTRFTYNGGTNKEQAVYYINAKEIIDNPFGTPNPVMFQDWSHAIPNQMTGELNPLRTTVRCHGNYTFKITDPALFMSRIAGTKDEYKKSEINEQIKTEVLSSFASVLNELGNSVNKYPVLELRSATNKIKTIMDERVFDQSIRDRGISIIGFVIRDVTLDDVSNKKIDEYELASNGYMQQGKIVSSYGDAVVAAANNPNGSINGMMGVGMVNMASGGMMGGTAAGVFNNQNLADSKQSYNAYDRPVEQSSTNTNPVNETVNTQVNAVVNEPSSEENKSSVSNTSNETLAFCPDCGTKKIGKFCTHCGKKLD